MNTITLRTYPAPLSRVCLGTALLAADGLTGEKARQAYDILDAYYELGGRFLDTAHVYGRWGLENTNASEQIIGRWLHDRQHTDVTVLTKACHFDPDTPEISRVDAASLLEDLDASRASLGQDKLDILLLHRDNEDVDIRTIVDFCVSAVEKGLMTRFGLSNYRAERIRTAIDYLGKDWDRYFIGVSNEWSLAMDGAENYAPGYGMVATDDAMKALQKEENFLILPYSSIAHGFYAKLQQCGASYNGAWQNTDAFRGERSWLTEKNGRMYNRLLALSEETGLSLTMLSLAYLLAQPNVIPAMSVSRPEQLSELGKVAAGSWTPEQFLI